MKNKWDIDTPALLVDLKILQKNIDEMQKRANKSGVNLRPHLKSHKTPAIAKMQLEAGAIGITVAKVSEAKVLIGEGLVNIFIGNEIYGSQKTEKLREMARKAKICIGVDNKEQISLLSQTFKDEEDPIEVLIEIETGNERSGLLPGPELVEFAKFIKKTPGVTLGGIFTHEGHTYNANTPIECAGLSKKSQKDILYAASLILKAGIELEVVSIGATPSLLHGAVLPGITEIRPGTYALMDVAQGHSIGDFNRCAVTVLATVVSKPTSERIILDAGRNALTSFTRNEGICSALEYGLIKGFDDLWLNRLFDEHGLINSKKAHSMFNIGDKIEIIPNHVCLTFNLYDKMYLIENERIHDELPILCRGKSQ